jgi:hypothetical protein
VQARERTSRERGAERSQNLVHIVVSERQELRAKFHKRTCERNRARAEIKPADTSFLLVGKLRDLLTEDFDVIKSCEVLYTKFVTDAEPHVRPS